MSVTLFGLSSLEAKFKKTVEDAEERIIKLRKEVAEALIESIAEIIPVWSGRALRSISVSNAGSGGNSMEPHPDRGDFSKDGEWAPHPEWKGGTQRSPARAVAMSSLREVNYDLESSVFIVSNSVIWYEINTKDHQFSNPVRHKVIISDIALADVRSRFKGRVK